jgi:cobalt-zinc-cadmium efflux system outer membrane protein
MNSRRWWVLAHLALMGSLTVAHGLAVAQPAIDQTGLSALTLEEALRRALENHPGLGAASSEVEAAEGRVQQAGLRPNPEIGVELENFSGDLEGTSESELSVLLSKRMETGGKRGARLAVARADRSAAGQDLRAARLDLVRDVQSDFVLALAAQRQLGLAEETLAISREVAATAQRKVEAGALPVVEAARARVAVSTAEIERERARDIVRSALERLAVNWGGRSVPDRIQGDLDSLSAVPTADTLITRLPENPDLARWIYQADVQRARLRLERTLRAPDLDLGGGYRHLAADDRGTFLLGLSVELPLLNRNQGAIREAAAEINRTSFEQERTRRALERNLRDQTARLRIAQAEVRGLRRSVLPGAQEVYEGVRQGYEQGRFTYLDVLEARRFLAQANEAEIAALSELEQSRIEIDRLTGQGEDLIDQVLEERP